MDPECLTDVPLLQAEIQAKGFDLTEQTRLYLCQPDTGEDVAFFCVPRFECFQSFAIMNTACYVVKTTTVCRVNNKRDNTPKKNIFPYLFTFKF